MTRFVVCGESVQTDLSTTEKCSKINFTRFPVFAAQTKFHQTLSCGSENTTSTPTWMNGQEIPFIIGTVETEMLVSTLLNYYSCGSYNHTCDSTTALCGLGVRLIMAFIIGYVVVQIVQNCTSSFMETGVDKQDWRQNIRDVAITKVTTPEPRRCRMPTTFFCWWFSMSTANNLFLRKPPHIKTTILPFSSISLFTAPLN